MFFPKWHLSIKGLIWAFSVSVLQLEEQAQPTLKPTLGLFLGEPLSAGATQSLLHPSRCRVDPTSPGCADTGGLGLSASLSPARVTPGDAPPLLPPGP